MYVYHFYVCIHMYVDIKVLYLLHRHLLVPASFLRGKIIINMISVHPYVFYLQPYSGKISIKLWLEKQGNLKYYLLLLTVYFDTCTRDYYLLFVH